MDEQSKKKGLEISIEYLRLAKEKDQRPENVPVFSVQQGEEPFSFRCHFHAWEEPKVKTYFPFQKVCQEIEASKLAVVIPPTTAGATMSTRLTTSLSKPLTPTSPKPQLAQVTLEEYHKTYSLAVLKSAPPKELDKTKLEVRLSLLD